MNEKDKFKLLAKNKIAKYIFAFSYMIMLYLGILGIYFLAALCGIIILIAIFFIIYYDVVFIKYSMKK